MAQVIKRGEKVYLIRVNLGRDDTGHRHYHNVTFHGSLSDAQKKARAIETQRDLGTLIKSSKITLGTYLRAWLDNAVKGAVRDRTYQDYDEYINRYIKPTLEFVRLTDLTPLHVQGVFNEMRDRG